jgi:TonB family protein
LRVDPGREHVLELNLEGHEVYSLKFPGESFGQRRIDARLVPLALASHEPPVDAGRKRVQRKRRARRGRGRLKSKLLSKSAPAELAADASAVAASDRHLVMAGLDTVAPALDVDVDLDPPVAPEEALAAPAQPASEANDSSEEQGDAPAVPAPPEDAAAAHSLAPVAAAKPPQPANAAAVVPPDEPVVQSTAEVMRRRRSGESPEYPRRALVDGLETTMEVRVVITPGGRIDDIEHLAGERMFRPSVERALRTWRFAPLVVGGRPVASTAVLKFVFKLDAT